MKITITKTISGSPDGIRVLPYTVGEEYEVPSPKMSAPLAKVFLTEGWAEEVKPQLPTPPENKDLNPEREFKKMLVPELKGLAAKAEIAGYEAMKKEELVDALEKDAAEKAAKAAGGESGTGGAPDGQGGQEVDG